MMHMQRNLLACLYLLLLVIAVGSLAGCGGCSDDSAQAKADKAKKELEEKKKKKPKPNFELGTVTVQPNNLTDRQFLVKPGHWTSATIDAVANNFDLLDGELVTDPLDLDGLPYKMGTWRPAILPKTQKKSMELLFHIPNRKPEGLLVRLNPDGGGRTLLSTPAALQHMPAHQFYFFVLAKEQDRYKYLEQTHAFRPLVTEFKEDDLKKFYRLVLPPISKRTPLPSTSLAWTSMAYLLWDDMPPHSLTLEQQEALVDWLHWGGQIIVSGPGTLELLRGSFLDPFLPVEGLGVVELDTEALSKMEFAASVEFEGNEPLAFSRSKDWSTFGKPTANKPWGCERLKLKGPEATVLVRAGSSGDAPPLVVERAVGRGRVVVTAFRLNQPELADWQISWPDYDMFLNACLLRRLPREYSHDTNENLARFSWRDAARSHTAETPAQVSRLEFFSRDTDPGKNRPAWLEPARGGLMGITINPQNFSTDDEDELLSIGPGVAGWDDWNSVAEVARESLNQAAGIQVPERMFIVKVLACYLFVLVPLNWAFFRLIGRLEWAWVAVPIITVVSTGLVVKMAEVNIGFARAQTEISVVEVQAAHARAHLTRYTALYTSLSTRYNVKMTDRTGLVMPLSDKKELQAWQSRSSLWLRRDENQVDLDGFEVGSNSMGLLHSEQMFALGGPIRLKELSATHVTVINESAYTLHDARVVGPLGIAQLGELRPGREAQAEFGGEDTSAAIEPASPEGSEVPAEHRIPIGRMLELARRSPRGELRLIAWSDESLPGLDVRPAANQLRQANVFVVHLRHAPTAVPQPDSAPLSRVAANLFKRKPPPPEQAEEVVP